MRQISKLRPTNEAEFAEAVEELKRTLDEALQAPEPEAWVERRGDFWANWDLGSWVNASHSYRADSRRATDAELLGVWQVLLPERPGSPADLQAHLTELAAWARSTHPKLSPEAWARAFHVMYAGAIYE